MDLLSVCVFVCGVCVLRLCVCRGVGRGVQVLGAGFLSVLTLQKLTIDVGAARQK